MRHALFFRRDDIEREHRQHRAVHGHRHAHLVERDAGEQRAHVVDGIDRDARHADIAGDARMVAVIAAVGGEIEGDREALLSGGEVAPVEGVGIFRRGEAGILPDGPGLRRVHGGVGAAQERRLAGISVEEVEAGEVGFAIDRLDRDAFRRLPEARVRPAAAAACRRNRRWQNSESGSCQTPQSINSCRWLTPQYCRFDLLRIGESGKARKRKGQRRSKSGFNGRNEARDNWVGERRKKKGGENKRQQTAAAPREKKIKREKEREKDAKTEWRPPVEQQGVERHGSSSQAGPRDWHYVMDLGRMGPHW